MSSGFRVAIDVGGTFTDCLVMEEASGELRQFKAYTTPADPSVGFVDALTKAAAGHQLSLESFLSAVELIIHGTTLATNTLITRTGARTGMITTRGFRDIVEIRRGYKNVRTSMYDLFVPPYEPLVPRYLRLEAAERMIHTGEEIVPLAEDEVRQAAVALKAKKVTSVAVGFLHGYADPAHEARAAEIVHEVMPEAYVTTSHEILPVWREFERFSTMLVSAYCGPRVERYLRSLEARLADSGFSGHLLMMLSDGLVETVDYCIPRVVYLIGSGPAAAPSGAVYIGNEVGRSDLLEIDMGGTSFDVCTIQAGEIPTTTDGWLLDERVAIKMVDIQTGGAGGGSIAWIDGLGLLRVGPQSAGGDPGPACYGRGGTEPAVTDADLLLGYVPPDYFLGGEESLDAEAAARAVRERIAEPLGLSVPEAAEAIFTTVNAYMADQVTEVSTRRGHDVRDFTLVAGGGAGPVHAAFIAEQLGIREVIIPPIAATFSAFGMLAMDIGRNFARSYISRAATVDLDRVNRLYAEMEAEARTAAAGLDIEADHIVLARTADMRYVGQFHEVEVEVPGGDITPAALDEAVANFHARHEQLYTFSLPRQAVEFLTFRLRATTPRAPFQMRRLEEGGADPAAALKRRRECWFNTQAVDTPIFDGAKLLAGNVLVGPAVIEEATTTVVIPPGYICRVTPTRSYLLERSAPSEPTPAAKAAATAGAPR